MAADGALVVPTVFDADEKSLGEIARETHTLADRVRAGTITPPELGGGTFTVSNLGMYGVQSFSAIINPPQAGILSVGALSTARGGARRRGRARANTMTLTLACDHRILYGAEAAQFLARIRELLETPVGADAVSELPDLALRREAPSFAQSRSGSIHRRPEKREKSLSDE